MAGAGRGGKGFEVVAASAEPVDRPCPAGVQSYSESAQLCAEVAIYAGVQLLTGAIQWHQIHSQRMTTAVLYLVSIDDREHCCRGDPWHGHAGGAGLAAGEREPI